MLSKPTEFQMSSWKKNLLAQKAEKDAKEDKIKKMVESGEMYKAMVSETIGFITTKIEKETQSSYTFQKAKDGIVTISIYGALVITPGLRLYSGALSIPRNPQTGKDYFFDSFRFKDKEQIEQFFDEVKKNLPEEVKFKKREAYPSDLAEEGSDVYDVSVTIDLND